LLTRLLCEPSSRLAACRVLSLHDALPISWAWSFWLTFTTIASWSSCSPHRARSTSSRDLPCQTGLISRRNRRMSSSRTKNLSWRSEEHTSELQSRLDLVCRLLLENKK